VISSRILTPLGPGVSTRLVFYFNGKSYGRLYQLIDHINDLSPVVTLEEHPERK